MALPRRISTEYFNLLLYLVISATNALLAVSLSLLLSDDAGNNINSVWAQDWGTFIGFTSVAYAWLCCLRTFEINQSLATLFFVGIDLTTKYLGFPQLVMLFYRDIEVNPPLDVLRKCHIIRGIWCHAMVFAFLLLLKILHGMPQASEWDIRGSLRTPGSTSQDRTVEIEDIEHGPAYAEQGVSAWSH
jgi:hypothetical protein